MFIKPKNRKIIGWTSIVSTFGASTILIYLGIRQLFILTGFSLFNTAKLTNIDSIGLIISAIIIHFSCKISSPHDN